jgi:RHS repeat-associated protein
MQTSSSTTALHFCAVVCFSASRYTGKERDTESGLDYFGARYYASNMGRWMSPDWADKPEAVPYSHLDDPQSLNLYGYVLNNPLRKADLDGHGCPPDCGDQAGSTEDRVLTRLTGAANLAIGVDRGLVAFGELAATPATFGVSTVAGLYEATQTAAQAGAGVSQIAGAITGRTEAANAKADSAIVHTSISGNVALKATHGNMDTAAKAAAAEVLVSTSATRSIFKSAAKMLDTALNILTTAKKPEPPPPPPPPTPQPHN